MISSLINYLYYSLFGIKQTKQNILVLDLDQTLIHSVKINPPSSLCSGDDAPYRLIRIKTVEIEESFLVAERSKYLHEALTIWKTAGFQIYVYTHGIRAYGEAILDLLDPQALFFDKKTRLMATPNHMAGDRTLKSLKRMCESFNLNHSDNNYLILDDNVSAWEVEDRGHVFQINPFVDQLLFVFDPIYLHPFSVQGRMHTELSNICEKGIESMPNANDPFRDVRIVGTKSRLLLPLDAFAKCTLSLNLGI